MISICITSYREERTIGKCLDSITTQKFPEPYEVLVACPDKGTAKVVKKYASKNSKIRFVEDRGKGKPAAMNLLLRRAKGHVLIFTDGDVFLGKSSIGKVLEHFGDTRVGAVSGRPVSLNSRKDMLGYWSHLLTDAGAHTERIKRARAGQFLVCSGYLYAIRKNIVHRIPEDQLAEDGWVSHYIAERGFGIKYEPEAKVFVRYPTTFSDWIKQKRRSAGGYHQINQRFEGKFRSLSKESTGLLRAIAYARNAREFLWSLLLIPTRLYLWALTYHDRISGKKFSQVWQRVESTKR